MALGDEPPLPFLNGPPAFVVGLKPIASACWLTPDTQAHTLPAKLRLMDLAPAATLQIAPSAQAPAAEAGALIGEAVAGAPVDFAAAARLVSDDLVVMTEGGAGWRAGALALTSATYFTLAQASGESLAALHGPVPDTLGPGGAQGLAARVGRIFSALAPDQVLERFNWTVQAGPERHTPSRKPLQARARKASVEDAAALVHLRVERQTIRKLPRTGAVLFTIRVSVDPLAPLLQTPERRAAFAQAWSAAPDHVRAYKGWGDYDRLIAALLDRA